MKHIYKPLVLLLFFFIYNTAHSQDNVEGVIDDLLLIADEFATPAANGAAYQASAGWFTSAQSLEPWQFEVSAHANALIVPSSKKQTTISNVSLQVLEIRDGSSARVPTAYGPTTDVYYDGPGIDSFRALEGVDKGFLGHGFLQATVGLPYESEFTIRALPELSTGGVALSTYGAGVKHNFSQYFRFNRPEDLQVSALITYSKFDANYQFESREIPMVAVLELVDVDADIWLFEVLASKRYEDFEIFGALGATNSTFGYQMDGSGPFLGDINTALETLSDSELQFKGDIGFNIYFDKFKVSTMATAGRFFNVNMGLHFRI